MQYAVKERDVANGLVLLKDVIDFAQQTIMKHMSCHLISTKRLIRKVLVITLLLAKSFKTKWFFMCVL